MHNNLFHLIKINKLDSLVETLTYLHENELIKSEFLSQINPTYKTLVLQESESLNLINKRKSRNIVAPIFLDLKVFNKIIENK